MKEPETKLNLAHVREARKIAETIKIGEAIPRSEWPDLRSQLFADYLEKADEFEKSPNFGGAVHTAMARDILDEIDRRRTQKARFHENMEPLVTVDETTGEAVEADVEDENASLEKFLGGLDRAERRRLIRNWHRRFRYAVRSLDPDMRDFLEKLAATTTQNELVAATRLCRKACFLRRKRLQQQFAGLLREHRDIKALEIK